MTGKIQSPSPDLKCSESFSRPFSETERGVTMSILEVLTLILVIFAALTYIDNRNNRK